MQTCELTNTLKTQISISEASGPCDETIDGQVGCYLKTYRIISYAYVQTKVTMSTDIAPGIYIKQMFIFDSCWLITLST